MNGHMLSTIRPSISQGAFGGGGLGGHELKSLLKLTNGWTDCHQIWHPCADSSSEWIYAKLIALRDTRWGLGGFRGSNIPKSGEAVKRLDPLAPTLVHVCGFIWHWT